MDTLADMREAVQSDLTVGGESTLYDTDTIDLAINRSYRKAGGMFRWPQLDDAKKTSTQANQEYYNYPTNWRPNSIWKLTVDGTDYGDPLAFKDYLYEQENDNPSGLDYMWANQWNRYFIDPIPTTTGSNNIVVWGQKVVSTLSADGDTTIFSYSMPECNEALVMEAVTILKAKGEEQKSGVLLSTEAKTILANAFAKIKQEQAKFEKTQPFFNVPDYFGSSRQKTINDIGDFN